MKKNIFLFFLLFTLFSCNRKKDKEIEKNEIINTNEVSSTEKKEEKTPVFEELNTQNAIPFFFEYEKKNPERKVRIITSLGNIDIELFKETPYHRANFIFLTKNKYFDGTCFHRIVKNFIIQGGNSDTWEVSKKRKKIGLYLLPPDTKKGFRHDRGILSMPSSDVDNPHQFASPYEFFIVCQKPGAYHLDGKYTAFGRVIRGMEVVDKINDYQVDKREWPLQNVLMKVVILE